MKSVNSKRMGLYAIVIICTLFPFSILIGGPGFTVTNVKLSKDYDAGRKNPLGVIESRDVLAQELKSGRVYFSCAIYGDQKTLKEIDRNGALNLEGNVFFDGVRTIPNIEFGMDQTDWRSDRSKLSQKVKEDGFFTWRTHFWFSIYRNDSKVPKKIEVQLRSGNFTVRETGSRISLRKKIRIRPKTK